MTKFFPFILAGMFFVSCSNETKSTDDTESTPKIVKAFNKKISALEEFDSKTPIADYAQEAEETAADKVTLTKENVSSLIEQMEQYTFSVIVVEDHTIVKISNIEDCKASGSWGACMPMGKGYIKRGDLVPKKDYINNIIGTPDSQKRVVYFFN